MVSRGAEVLQVTTVLLQRSNDYRHSMMVASICLVSPCRNNGGGKEDPSFRLLTAAHHFQGPARNALCCALPDVTRLPSSYGHTVDIHTTTS
jgi:hypothetical protein